MCVVCVGWARAIRQNKMFLSFIILIPLVKLTNQKRGTCRHLILYLIWIRPSFPNDAQTLRPKASVKPNQILNWLEECYNGKYSLSNEQKSNFGNRMTKVAISPCTGAVACVCGPKHAYTSTLLCTQLGFQRHKKDKFSAIMAEVWNESHIIWELFQTPFFPLFKALHGIFSKHTKHHQVNFVWLGSFLTPILLV